MVFLFFLFLATVGALSVGCEEECMSMMREMEQTLDLKLLAALPPDVKLGVILPVLLELFNNWSNLGTWKQMTIASTMKGRLKNMLASCHKKEEL